MCAQKPAARNDAKPTKKREDLRRFEPFPPKKGPPRSRERAGDGVRTHDNDVGNVVLYQLSYTRLSLCVRLPWRISKL